MCQQRRGKKKNDMANKRTWQGDKAKFDAAKINEDKKP